MDNANGNMYYYNRNDNENNYENENENESKMAKRNRLGFSYIQCISVRPVVIERNMKENQMQTSRRVFNNSMVVGQFQIRNRDKSNEECQTQFR